MKKLKIKSSDVINSFTKKFGKYDEMVVKKSFTYFEDAEKEPEFPFLKRGNWNSIKRFFLKGVC